MPPRVAPLCATRARWQTRSVRIALSSLVLVSVATLGSLGSLGCSQASPAAGDAGAPPADGTPSFCATDVRAQSYHPGLQQAGKAGKLAVQLDSIAPAPVARGDNRWTFTLLDAAGAPVTGATVSVLPYMPDHRHGSAITPAVAPGTKPGEYVLSRLNLFMPGLWQITLTPVAGALTDDVVFTFCVAE